MKSESGTDGSSRLCFFCTYRSISPDKAIYCFKEVRTGVTVWDNLAAYLPEAWIRALKALTYTEQDSIQRNYLFG